MIKVECVSCQAPYELDPRRIPDKGMKMRCPKCGASFVVARDGSVSQAGAAAPAVVPPMPPPPVGAPPPPAAAHKHTMIGAAAPPTVGMPAPVPAPPRAPAASPAAAPKLKTSIGMAAPWLAQPEPEKPPAGSLKPPPGPPIAAARAPAPPGAPVPSAVNRAAAAKGAFGATMMGPAVVGVKPQPAPAPPVAAPASDEPSFDVDLPDDLPPESPSTDLPDLSVSHIRVDQLPVPSAEVDLPSPRAAASFVLDSDSDLPAFKAAPAGPSYARASAPSFGDLDLPAPRAPAPLKASFGDLDLPAKKPEAPKPSSAFGDLDLPTAKSPGAPARSGGFGDLDLPAPKARQSPNRTTAGSGFGEVDLPARRIDADLPAVKDGADLPAPLGGSDLPTVKSAADLPAPKPMADLPTPKSTADLPVPKSGFDLPTAKGGGFGDLELPPARGGAARRSDEASFADIELDLPEPIASSSAQSGGGFGDIELPPPKPAAGLVPPKARTVQGVGAHKPTPNEASFGNLGLGDDRDSDLPPSLLGEDESSFGDLNEEPRSPAPRAVPAPPRPRAAAPVDEVEELEPDDELGGGSEEEEDDFGEEEFEDESEGEEEMEFGISGEGGERGSLPPEMLRRQRGEDFEAKQAALGKRALTIAVRLAVVLVLLVGGGAALNFTEYGVFGVYYWEQWLPEAGDAQFARSAIDRAEKMGSSDDYPDVKRSLKELGEARRKAGLNRLLLTRSLMHESLFIVRYGEDSNSAAHAAAILKRLEERSFKAPGMDLARAADAARRRQFGEVHGPLAAARAQAGSDPFVELLAGEVGLAEGKLEVAEKAFARALQLGGGARAQWGLTRVAMRRGDLEAQAAAVNETLKLSPMHVEARIAEASIAWTQGKEERAMHLLRVALGLEPTEDDRRLWSSKQAVAMGYSLLGFMHEVRGRLHPARDAYEQALTADPYRVEALLGAGRVLLKEKRHNDALARFEAAVTSATKGGENPTLLSGRKADAEAQLGIGRALLALDNPPEAKAKLEALVATLPNDAEVVLALGEAEQLMGHPDIAETHFRKSIELAPKRFDGYLALSQLFVKQGDAGKASEILNEAASQVEETAEMRRMLGQSELARNRLDSAIHEFKRALELDPHDLHAMFGKATALRKHGDLDEAASVLSEIEKRDAAFGGLAEQNGLLFEARGDFGKAVAAYTAALEKDPADVRLQLRLGGAHVEAGNYDLAEQTLAKVIREMPNSAEAEYFIGRIAFGRGRTADALTHFDRAVGLDGTRGEYHLYVARAALDMGNLARTLEEVAAAITFDPSLGDIYWVRGMVRLRMGAVKDALSDINKALKLNPGRTEAYAVMGDCYEQLRQIPDAMRAYRTALGRKPDRGEWWFKLASLEADIGDRSATEASVRKAITLGDQADPMPSWLPEAYRISGETSELRGDRASAIRAFKRYLEVAPAAAIDRRPIEQKLRGWGVQLVEEE